MSDEMNEVEQAIHASQLYVAFEGIALDALRPLIQARDSGEVVLPLDVWFRVVCSVKQRIAETYFGTNDRLPQDGLDEVSE